MSIASEISRLQGAKSDLKTSIEGKGVTVPSATKIDGYAALVDQIQQGGGGTTVDSDADVRFFDYDGTLLHTYTAADFANLTELPANPSHQGLTAQGWNWSLVDAKAYVASYGILDIGQMYVTDDGKTRAYFSFPQGGRLDLMLRFVQSLANGVTLDWGDGSATETFAGTGEKTPSHTYAAAGDYVVTFTVAEGCTLMLGNYSSFIANTGATLYPANMALWKIEMGERITELGWVGPAANLFCGLKYLTIPQTVVSSGVRGQVTDCKYLKALTLPINYETTRQGFTNNWALQFFSLNKKSKIFPLTNSGRSLTHLAIPEGYAAVGALSLCERLAKCAIPSGVASIPDAMRGLSHLLELHIPTGVTAIVNRAFEQTTMLRKVTLPSGLLTIGNSFCSSSMLEEVTIPDTVTTIGTAFTTSSYLEILRLGSGLTSIGAAFTGVYSLKEIHITATTPPTLTAGAFSNMPADCIIYVPSASLTAYQGASNWSTYASQMVGE
jgi:hypothetical protein